MKVYKYILMILASFQVTAAPVVLTVGPGDDGDCDYNSIQEAIDSGGLNMDIRVSNQLLTTTGAAIIDNGVTSLTGGYFNCQAAVDGIVDDFNPRSSISNDNGKALVITNLINHSHYLYVSGFNFENSAGGVDITSGAANTILDVVFSVVNIRHNSSVGLRISSVGGAVVHFNNGSINNNSNPSSAGGGVWCSNSEFNIGEYSAINDNFGNVGGGVHSFKCDIKLLAGDNNSLDSLQYGVFNNLSMTGGAGFFLDQSVLYGFDTMNHPISIVNNEVLGSIHGGGGVYMNSDSSLLIANIRLESNTAKVAGGGIDAIHDDINKNPPSIYLLEDANGCSYAEICSSLSFNRATDTDGEGAVLAFDGTGFAYIMESLVANNGSEIDSGSILMVKNGATLILINDLVINNSTSSDLIGMENISEVYIQQTTLADNPINNYFNVLYDNNNPQVLEVIGSIIKNGDATIANLNNDNDSHDAKVKCSLVETNDTTGVVQNQSVIGLPNFVGNGNYKLSPNSIAIDSNCTAVEVNDLAELDIRGQSRIEDGLADLGAYEYIAIDDVVFQNGFE